MRVSLVALCVLSLTAACTGAPSDGWRGGPVTPSPVTITVNPILKVPDAIPTGIVVGQDEMLLYFFPGPNPYLSHTWRDITSGALVEHVPGESGTFCRGEDGFRQLYQANAGDGTVIEYGGLPLAVARITIRDGGGPTVEARFTASPRDPAVTVFWLRRHSEPVPRNRPVSPVGYDGIVSEPLAPEEYPLVTAYDAAGKVLAQSRFRPPAEQQKGG